jgi:hypothetical protein
MSKNFLVNSPYVGRVNLKKAHYQAAVVCVLNTPIGVFNKRNNLSKMMKSALLITN